MRLRIWKRIFLTPFVRLNIIDGNLSLSFGHRRMGWLTIGRQGIRATLDTPVPGVYLMESRRWKEISHPPKN